MPPDIPFCRSRIFLGSDRVEYEWKIQNRKPCVCLSTLLAQVISLRHTFQLYIANTNKLVAQFQRAQPLEGGFQPPCNNYIELSTQAIGTLELVIITGLIMEAQRRRDEAQQAMTGQ